MDAREKTGPEEALPKKSSGIIQESCKRKVRPYSRDDEAKSDMRDARARAFGGKVSI